MEHSQDERVKCLTSILFDSFTLELWYKRGRNNRLEKNIYLPFITWNKINSSKPSVPITYTLE